MACRHRSEIVKLSSTALQDTDDSEQDKASSKCEMALFMATTIHTLTLTILSRPIWAHQAMVNTLAHKMLWLRKELWKGCCYSESG